MIVTQEHRIQAVKVLQSGSCAAMQDLLSDGFPMNTEFEIPDAHHRSALIHHVIEAKGISESAKVEMLGLLASHGADLHKNDEFGFSPLMNAAMHSLKDVCHFLIENGADVHYIEPENHESAISIAVRKDLPEIVLMLLNKGVSPNWSYPGSGQKSLLHISAETFRPAGNAVMGILIRHGANVNAVTQDGRTPLSFCASIETMLTLVRNGADVHLGDLLVRLDAAGRSDQFAAASALGAKWPKEEMGAGPVLMRNHELIGKSYMFCALELDNQNVMQHIIDHGADPQALKQDLEDAGKANPGFIRNNTYGFAHALLSSQIAKQRIDAVLRSKRPHQER